MEGMSGLYLATVFKPIDIQLSDALVPAPFSVFVLSYDRRRSNRVKSFSMIDRHV